MEGHVRRHALAWLVVAACGSEAGINKPGAMHDDDGVAQRYPDLAALYGGAHGIYSSCAPNEGVCHNNQEYPDLATLGGVLQTVGARCNRARALTEDVHDLCEGAGDFVVAGDRRAQIASLSFPGPNPNEPIDEFSELVYRWDEVWIQTERPLPVRVGDLLAVRRRDGEALRDVVQLKVVRPARERPQGRNVIVAQPEYTTEAQELAADYGEGERLREGDPNHNGVLGAALAGGLVVPGDPERSYLMRRLVDPSAGPLMPRANCCTWTKQSLRATWCWIAGLEPDGSNALDPIDYASCPAGPEEAVVYPQPGPSCATSGRCPVTARVELEGGATWDAVYGVLASRCGDRNCHGPGASNGLQLTANAQQSLAAFVVPGDPARSELYRRITPDLAEASAVELMPLHRKPLTLRERELVRAFIAAMPNESSR
jgi:hypothetical protein